jgi:hypothetical protein
MVVPVDDPVPSVSPTIKTYFGAAGVPHNPTMWFLMVARAVPAGTLYTLTVKPIFVLWAMKASNAGLPT